MASLRQNLPLPGQVITNVCASFTHIHSLVNWFKVNMYKNTGGMGILQR